MNELLSKRCIPCEGKVKPLTDQEIIHLRTQINEGWMVDDIEYEVPFCDTQGKIRLLSKIYQFANFRQAMTFSDKVGEVAESQGHHPDIRFGWGYVEINIFTHSINGLSENDFILAAKIDNIKGY